jgi:hypothetical protein
MLIMVHYCKQVVDPPSPTLADAIIEETALIESGSAALELTVIRARSAAAMAVGAEASLYFVLQADCLHHCSS